jgi:hypothetical protein
VLDISTNCDYDHRRPNPLAGTRAYETILTGDAERRSAFGRPPPACWRLTATYARDVAVDLLQEQRYGNIQLNLTLYPIRTKDGAT